MVGHLGTKQRCARAWLCSTTSLPPTGSTSRPTTSHERCQRCRRRTTSASRCATARCSSAATTATPAPSRAPWCRVDALHSPYSMILVYGRRTDQRAGRDSDSEICGHRSSYPMVLINQRYRRPPVDCAAGMADSERPQLAHTDVEVLRYFEKRMLIIELCDSYTRGVTASTVVT